MTLRVGQSLGLMALALCLCGAKEPDKDEAFNRAVDALADGQDDRAADEAWAFLANADHDDPRYDRGRRLLSQSLAGLGLHWGAAMVSRDIARERRSAELVPEAIGDLARYVDAGGADMDAVIDGFIAADELPGLDRDLQAFVDYYKGLDLMRRGLYDWAEASFARIPATSDYAPRAEYVRIVRLVALRKDDEAIPRLEALDLKDAIPDDLRLDVRRSLARLAYEHGRYDEALVRFEQLRVLAPDDPEILLEMAWTHYAVGDAHTALGMLVALDAPVHQTAITPERFLLEALALRQLCQFSAARAAAVALDDRYGDALAALRSGVEPQDIDELRTAALRRPNLRDHTLFVANIEEEGHAVHRSHLDASLEKWLDAMYARGIDEAEAQQRALLDREVGALTEELLVADEGVRLIVHELGVAMLRGRRRPEDAPLELVPVEDFGLDRAVYAFDGEYWTDELDDLLVVAEDRCLE